MNFLQQIYNDIESETDNEVKKSNKAALYTLVNYLEATDNGPGITKKEMNERFLKRKEFSTIFRALQENSVIEITQDGNYKLNPDAKTIISPLFEEITNLVYRQKNTLVTKDNPTLDLLYNCRSQIFSS